MILTLEITGPQAAKLGAACRKVFHASGGTIGRLPDNQWALPDPYVSSRHALIRYQDGVFYIEDTSTNGIFINAPDKRLSKGSRTPCRRATGSSSSRMRFAQPSRATPKPYPQAPRSMICSPRPSPLFHP